MIYRVNGVEVTRDEFLANAEKSKPAKGAKQRGRRFRTPGMFGDFGDWRRETDPKTGKNGRYCPQLARRPGDPDAVCKNKTELIERGKRRGYSVEAD